MWFKNSGWVQNTWVNISKNIQTQHKKLKYVGTVEETYIREQIVGSLINHKTAHSINIGDLNPPPHPM